MIEIGQHYVELATLRAIKIIAVGTNEFIGEDFVRFAYFDEPNATRQLSVPEFERLTKPGAPK